MQTTANFDRAAAGFSLLCIAHCVALPVFAISLPFLAAAAEAEWIHWAFTALAIIASTIVIARSPGARNAVFMVPALAGIGLITAALFAENFGMEETLPTVLGGGLLATAHIYRLFKTS